MSIRRHVTRIAGVTALVAGSAVAMGTPASAHNGLTTETCTMTYSGPGAPAAQTFQSGINWAYAEHGDVWGTPPMVHVANHQTQIDLPAAVVTRMAETGVGHNTPVSGAEYYTVDGVAGTAPMVSTANPVHQVHGVATIPVFGDKTDIMVPAGASTKGPVHVKHSGTTVTWKSTSGISGTLTCGTIPAPSKPTEPTPKPTTPVPSTPAPSTPAPTTPAPTSPVPSTTGHTTPAPTTPAPTKTSGTGTGTAKPTNTTTTTGQGPKVQTDKVSEGSNFGIAGGAAAAAGLALAGTAVAARRIRKN